jgi:hypothetical protein
MKRKIIQICTSVINDTEAVYALCDDGTVWCLTWSHPSQWDRMHDIPQEEDQPE